MLEKFRGYVLEKNGTGKACQRCGHMSDFLREELSFVR